MGNGEGGLRGRNRCIGGDGPTGGGGEGFAVSGDIIAVLTGWLRRRRTLLLVARVIEFAAVVVLLVVQWTSHAVHAGEPLAQFVAHVLPGRRRGAERPERRRPRLVVMLVMVLVVPAVPVVSAARDAHATAPPEPIAAPGTRPPPAAQAPGQHQRQHRAHGQHRRQHHVVHGLRFHRTCQTARNHSLSTF